MGNVKRVFCMVESFPTTAFNESIVPFDDSIVINFNPHRVWISVVPSTIKLKKKAFPFLDMIIQKLHQYSLIAGFLVQTLRLFILLTVICVRFRPQVVIAESYLISMLTAILRSCGVCGKSAYIAGDWFQSNEVEVRLVSRIHRKYIFPFVDYLSCRWNDAVFNISDKIGEARLKYWGRRISNFEKTVPFPLKPLTRNLDLNARKNNIFFMGNLRYDSGLDIVIKSLPRIREHIETTLVIVGPLGHGYQYFRDLARHHHVERHVTYYGFIENFVESEKFHDIVSTCFCGVNLVTTSTSYTFYTLPAKVLIYLQYLLPVIVSPYVGDVSDSVQKNNLGLVIEPSERSFTEAILKIHTDQQQYRKDVFEYIDQRSKIGIGDFLVVDDHNAFEEHKDLHEVYKQ